MRLLLISDTHVPGRRRAVPDPVWRAVDEADVVVHAGDWDGADLLDRLRGRARRLIGVYGNNDGPEIRRQLPEVATETLEGLRITVVHETGPAAGRERRCAARFPATDVLVFGHSHIPWDTVADTRLRLLNPGSPTDRRRRPTHTWMTARIDDGRLVDVELHHLETPPNAAPGRPDGTPSTPGRPPG